LKDRELNKTTNIYAFGMLLFELLTKEPAFDTNFSPLKIAGLIVNGTRPTIPENIPKHLKGKIFNIKNNISRAHRKMLEARTNTTSNLGNYQGSFTQMNI
jgi:hypothetical protein